MSTKSDKAEGMLRTGETVINEMKNLTFKF